MAIQAPDSFEGGKGVLFFPSLRKAAGAGLGGVEYQLQFYVFFTTKCSTTGNLDEDNGGIGFHPEDLLPQGWGSRSGRGHVARTTIGYLRVPDYCRDYQYSCPVMRLDAFKA